MGRQTCLQSNEAQEGGGGLGSRHSGEWESRAQQLRARCGSWPAFWLLKSGANGSRWYLFCLIISVLAERFAATCCVLRLFSPLSLP